jgi:hypothetical protein
MQGTDPWRGLGPYLRGGALSEFFVIPVRKSTGQACQWPVEGQPCGRELRNGAKACVVHLLARESQQQRAWRKRRREAEGKRIQDRRPPFRSF